MLAQRRLDAMVADRPLHVLLCLAESERAAIANASAEVDATWDAAWDESGNSILRDADEPMARD